MRATRSDRPPPKPMPPDDDGLPPCSYRGRKDEPWWDYARRIFPCFRKGTVRIREVSDRTHNGNPFRERMVCRVHADEMIESGWYLEVPTTLEVS